MVTVPPTTEAAPAARPVAEHSGPRRARSGRAVPYALVAPAVAVLAVVLGYPVVQLVVLSVQDYGPRSLFTGEAPFVGAGNYLEVLGAPAFWWVLVRTAFVAAVTVGVLMTVGFVLASLLLRVSPWARLVLTVCLVLVWAMPMVSAVVIWQWMFQPQYGVLNWIGTQLQVFGDLSARDWFAEPASALAVVLLLIVWKGLPFVVLTMFAALGQIPAELYEAARVDKANAFQSFRYVTYPMLRPLLAILVILEVIWSVNSFTPFWVLTQGGPDDATTTLGVFTYLTAFTRNDYGLGSAVAVLTVLLLAAFAVVYVRRLIASGEVR